MVTSIQDETKKIIDDAAAVLLEPGKLAELTAAPKEIPAECGSARRSALMALVQRRADVAAHSAELGKVWAPFVEAGYTGTLSMAESALKNRLGAQRQACSTFTVETAVDAGGLPDCVPGNITSAEETLRGLAPVIRDQSISDALAAITEMRRSANWKTMTDWSFELTVKL